MPAKITSISMSEQQQEALAAIAAAENTTQSGLVRTLMARLAERRGYDWPADEKRIHHITKLQLENQRLNKLVDMLTTEGEHDE